MELHCSSRKLMFTLSIALISVTLFAQKATYTTNGGMIIGFGLGATYQQSDIANSLGTGFDFQLGSYLYHEENAFLSVDWKFRFLGGWNTAFDHRMNPDSSYSNIQYRFFNYDLELGLTLNRLRERTRILLGGFAGVGITHGRTFTDLYDANTLPYDYSSINPSLSRSEIHTELLNLSDKNFETALVNRAVVMPTAGLFFGYQFSRSFSMSVEHKINFSLSEDNGIFGIDMDNKVLSGSGIDMNHYTALTFRWSLGRSSTTYRDRYQTPEVVTSPVYNDSLVNAAANARPIQRFDRDTVSRRNPVTRPRVTGRPVVVTQPVVTPPRPSQPVTPVQPPATVTPKPENPPVTTTEQPAGPPPRVTFVQPETAVTVNRAIYPVKATTRNVQAWQDVDVFVNGISNSNFSFAQDGTVHLNTALKEGVNTIEIIVENPNGKAKASTSITYEPPVIIPPPEITLAVPGSTQVSTQENTQKILAYVEGISGAKDLTITLNRKPFTRFTYNPDSKELTFTVPLTMGANNVTITARNAAGTDMERISILRTEPRCDPPEVSMIVPDRYETTTTDQDFLFQARINRVSGRNQMKLIYNGNSVNNFSFEGNLFRYRQPLKEGENSFSLTVTNECGSRNISRTVYYQPEPVELPCYEPEIKVSLEESQQQGATHVLTGSISNITSTGGITLRVNGTPYSGFSFDPATGRFFRNLKLEPGTYHITLEARNECGKDEHTFSVNVVTPCVDPTVDFRVTKAGDEDFRYRLDGEVREITNRTGVSMTVNGRTFSGFGFDVSSGRITGNFNWNPGTYTVQVRVANACGSAVKSAQVTVAEPCKEPEVQLKIDKAEGSNITHRLQGKVTNTPRSGIRITVNGAPFSTFQFNAPSGKVSANLNLQPGQHKITLAATNDCGTDEKSVVVVVEKKEEEEAPCAVRINPGNADWQFCLVTPRGTFNRSRLKDKAFRYSGPASSLYFSPIAGGGQATVNGKPYNLSPGTYYLFRGNLNVVVSTQNKGSMGQWSVCITADRAPASGKGNNRPHSPCEDNANKKDNKDSGRK